MKKGLRKRLRRRNLSWLVFVLSFFISFILFGLVFLLIFSMFPETEKVRNLFQGLGELGFPGTRSVITGRQILDICADADLFLYMPFDDGTARDLSSSGISSVVTGATWISAGKIGGAFTFDKSGDYITLSDGDRLDFESATEDFSVLAWIRTTSPADGDVIMQKMDDLGDGWRLILLGNGRVRGYINGTMAESSVAVSDGQWHYVGFVADRNGNLQVYVDGVTSGSGVSLSGQTMNIALQLSRIGASSYNPSYTLFGGNIDEVMIFNRVLSSADISSLYTGYSCSTTPCTPNWQCSAWSTCNGGVQTRTCTDSNNCGTTSGKPAESQSCSEGGSGSENFSNLSADIFERQYAFRLPSPISEYSTGVIAFDPNKPDEFWVVTFDNSNPGPDDEIAKFRIPATTSNSNDVNDLPFATLIQGPVDIWPKITNNPNGNNQISSLLAVKNPQNMTKTILIFGAYQFYDQNIDENQNYTIGVIDNPDDLANSPVRGFLALEGARHRDLTSGFLSMVQQEYRSIFGGDIMLGTEGGSVTESPEVKAEGLMAYVFNLSDLLGANLTSSIPTNVLVDYPPAPIGQPARTLYDPPGTDGQYNRYLNNTRYGYISGQRLGFVVPGTDSVAFVGHSGGFTAPSTTNNPPSCYEYCPGNSLGYQDTSSCWPVIYKGCQINPLNGQLVPQGAGPGSTTGDYTPYVWYYKIEDLEKVATGQLNPWDVVPYGWGKFSQTQVPNNYSLPINLDFFVRRTGGASYDDVNKILYLSFEKADRPSVNVERPLIVAFKINVGVCGNGVVESGESCDDGNLVNGDGCSSACIVESSGLIGWWTFDENNTAVNDYSGNGFGGTVYKAIFTQNGKLNGAYEFSDNQEPSDHSYIRINHSNYYSPNRLDLVNSEVVSYFGWFKSNKDLSDLGSVWDSYVVFKPKNTFLLGWAGWSHDGWECNVWNQSDPNQRIAVWKTRPLVKNEWVHVGCVFNGTWLGLYINGTLASFNSTIPNYKLQNNTFGGEQYYDLFIGSKNQYPYYNLTWNGTIDEVRIYDKALTSGEIQSLYDAESVACGNGIVEAGEQCDDGNIDNNDACTNSCIDAICGDSYIRTGVEQCDDGNLVNGDGCSSSCQTEVIQTSFCAPLPPPTGNTITVSPSDNLPNIVAGAVSGTTILLQDGTYSLSGRLDFNNLGVSLRSQSGNRDAVILDGGYSIGEPIYIDVDNITVADVTIRKAFYHNIHVVSGGNNVLLYNLKLLDASQQFVKVNPDTPSMIENGTLACSYLELTDMGRPFVSDQSSVGAGDCYTGGLDGHQNKNWIVRDNIIKNIYCTGRVNIAEHGIHFWNGGSNNLVERNILINNSRGIGFGLWGSGTSGGTIRNNFIYANIAQFDSGIGIEDSPNSLVYHNTIYSSHGVFNVPIDIRGTLSDSSVIVRNNLHEPDISIRDGATPIMSNNVRATAGMFVNLALGDLHLVSTATSAINQGTNVGIAQDIDGQNRDSQPDVGADEFVVGGSVCGNGLVESGEGCDDGNTFNGDGCSSSCGIESGWSCSEEPSVCSRLVCTLSSASWSTSSAIEGETVGLQVSGSNCNGDLLDYTIMEYDPTILMPDDFVTSFLSSSMSPNWTALYESEGGLDPDPEYYFEVFVVSNPNEKMTSSDPKLSVTKALTPCTDIDGDGYGIGDTSSCPQPGIDCNDFFNTTYPGAPEVCNDLDNNCANGIADEVKNTYYRDSDGDGYGNATDLVQSCTQPAGYVLDNTDCNDNDALSHQYFACPSNGTRCGSFSYCIPSPASCPVPPPEICGNGIDEDCNGADVFCSLEKPLLIYRAPMNKTYRNQLIPFNFSGLSATNCWYLFDQVRHNSSCEVGVNFKPQAGQHNLSVFANNSQGIIQEERQFSVVYTRKFIVKYDKFTTSSGTSGIIPIVFSALANGDGRKTTNLTDELISDVDLQNILLTLDQGTYGWIEWLEPLNLTQGANPVTDVIDLDEVVDIASNYVDIKSSVAPYLNKRARIVMHSLNFQNPRILRDGVVCNAPDCVIESYTLGTLIFNVSGFTNYRAEETPETPSPPQQPGTSPGGPGTPPRNASQNQTLQNETRFVPVENKSEEEEEIPPGEGEEERPQLGENVKRNLSSIILALIIVIIVAGIILWFVWQHQKHEVEKIAEEFREQFQTQ